MSDAMIDAFGADDAFRWRVEAEEQVLDFLGNLRDRMDDGNVTQTELAGRLGLTKTQLHRWLAGKNEFKASTMFMLARALDFTLEVSWCPRSEWGWSPRASRPRRPYDPPASRAPASPAQRSTT